MGRHPDGSVQSFVYFPCREGNRGAGRGFRNCPPGWADWFRLERSKGGGSSAPNDTAMHEQVSADLKTAIQELRRTGAGFVIVEGQHTFAASNDHGIQTLLAAAERLRGRGRSDAALADRVLGRAALLVAVWAGIRFCHGETMSEDAIREAGERGLTFSCGVRVPMILDRTGNGRCPFEVATADALGPDEAVAKIRATLRAPMARQHV